MQMNSTEKANHFLNQLTFVQLQRLYASNGLFEVDHGQLVPHLQTFLHKNTTIGSAQKIS
jgi:hypothetical protein